ncbi:MAG: DUF5615 family PIN-like protein [Anaerolineae bacterium]
MKLLVDVGVGKAVEVWLAGQDHDVKAVGDLNPRMTDDDILLLAVQEERLVITMDKDFGQMVFHTGRAHAGVLLLRMEDARSAEKVKPSNASSPGMQTRSRETSAFTRTTG